MNGANDYFDIAPGDDFTGEFILVPADVARGDTADLPQDALEDWSNANNVFQFVRVEDIAYDPDSPRTVYFADTGNSRLLDPGTGRLYRASSGGAFAGGRIFKMVMNANDPTVVDSFSVLLDAASIGMRTPDNVAVSHDTLMVQEDTSSFSKIWAAHSRPVPGPTSPRGRRGRPRRAASWTSPAGSATVAGARCPVA